MSTAAVFLALDSTPNASTARRLSYLAYGLAAYIMFLGVYLYAYGFVMNIAAPCSIDAPSAPLDQLPAVTNLVLLAAFGVQHSLMARPTFKRWWTQFVPEPLERSTYVLLSNILMIALFLFWRPMPTLIWNVQFPLARAALLGLNAAGWLLVVVATLLLNHFDLFGLRQVWLYFRNRPYTRLPFRMPFLYRHVRHPLYVGWLAAFWITPTMSAGHLLFALSMTAYILIAIYFEERNLLEAHGESYAAYRRKVPMLAPSWRP